MQDTSMSDIIYDYFTSRIQSGYYVYGERLPSISNICRQFQVSTLTVRSALSKLKEQQYIETSARKAATVTYTPVKQSEQQYIGYFLSRKDGMEDIARSASIIFDPVNSLYFKEQNHESVKRIRWQLKKTGGHAAKQITLFYAEIAQQFKNPLFLNLYWEIIRYLRIPYLHRPADFDNAGQQVFSHYQRLLNLFEHGQADEISKEAQKFHEILLAEFLEYLSNLQKKGMRVKQVPFRWHIYRKRPQLCYSLAADILSKIDNKIYRQEELLPSCQTLAKEYHVSLITMRRTLELLGNMRVIETLNGVGTKVISKKNLEAPDLSMPQIQTNLIFFFRALQMCALTCKNVSYHTFSVLDDTDFQALDDRIQKCISGDTLYLLDETCLQFIGEKSPSAMIRETYHQLYHLLLWGHTLHIFFQQLENSKFYTEYAARLLREVHMQNIDGFADALYEHISEGVAVCRNLFLQLGFDKDKLS